MATFTIEFYDQTTRQEVTSPDDLDAHNTYSVALCDADGSRVYFESPGEAETAHCQRKHRWQQAFAGPRQDGGWIALE